jgi:hypothetical protein
LEQVLVQEWEIEMEIVLVMVTEQVLEFELAIVLAIELD